MKIGKIDSFDGRESEAILLPEFKRVWVGTSVTAAEWCALDVSDILANDRCTVVDANSGTLEGKGGICGVFTATVDGATTPQFTTIQVAGKYENAVVNTSTAEGDPLVASGTAGEAGLGSGVSTNDYRIAGIALEVDTAGVADVLIYKHPAFLR